MAADILEYPTQRLPNSPFFWHCRARRLHSVKTSWSINLSACSPDPKVVWFIRSTTTSNSTGCLVANRWKPWKPWKLWLQVPRSDSMWPLHVTGYFLKQYTFLSGREGKTLPVCWVCKINKSQETSSTPTSVCNGALAVGHVHFWWGPVEACKICEIYHPVPMSDRTPPHIPRLRAASGASVTSSTSFSRHRKIPGHGSCCASSSWRPSW